MGVPTGMKPMPLNFFLLSKGYYKYKYWPEEFKPGCDTKIVISRTILFGEVDWTIIE